MNSSLLELIHVILGALDEAAELFTAAVDSGESPKDFVQRMKKENKLIMGIGHRIKSLTNPDKRVTLVKNYAQKNFKDTSILEFALAVEQITTTKKANLILNVDGCIACCFVDMVRSCGSFSREEADDLLNFGVLNGLFVLGRSMGFIAHFIDQKRLKQVNTKSGFHVNLAWLNIFLKPLYRHPWEDISYIQQVPENIHVNCDFTLESRV